MKALKCWGFGPRKSKSGFTLIELLIVMVILAILAGVVVMAVGGVFGSAKSAAYKSVHDDIQNAVTAYSTNHAGSFPSIASSNGSVPITNCSSCLVINMSALLTSNGGMLRKIPDGCYFSNSSTGDNCGGNASLGCLTTSHYIWGVDQYGSIFSSCNNGSGTACTQANTVDGYAGVWP